MLKTPPRLGSDGHGQLVERNRHTLIRRLLNCQLAVSAPGFVAWPWTVGAVRLRPCRHAVGDRWQVNETYVKVAGQWRYVYRVVDQFGQVIDVFVSPRRDATAARRFLERAIGSTKVRPAEVTTDQAPVCPTLMEELLPAAWHGTDRYANNRVECDQRWRLQHALGRAQRNTASLDPL